MSDRIAGTALLALAVWYGLTAGQYKAGFSDPLGPAVFPQLLAVPLGLLSLYLIVKPDAEPNWVGGWALARQVAAVVTLVVYALALEPVGFLLATLVAVALLARLLGANWRQGAGVGAGLAGVLFVAFDIVLGLPLPVGRLFAA